MSDRATYALIMGIGMTLLLGGLGFIFRRLIWQSKEAAANRIELARKFASNFVFAASLASGSFFIKNGIAEALVQMVVVVVTFGVFGFLLGLMYWIVIKEKNWSLLLWLLGAAVILSFSANDDFGDEDMNFSMKYALLYAVAGFVASAYHLKERESGKIAALGGLALCVLYTVSIYGLNYGILTAIEYAVGYGLAQLILRKENKGEAPNISSDSNKSDALFNATASEVVDPTHQASTTSGNSNEDSKALSKSNGFWFFMAVMVMSGTALLIQLGPDRLPSIVDSSNLELPAVISPAASPLSETQVSTEGAAESLKKKNDPPQFENTYLEIDREFRASPKGSQEVMVIKVALMTHFDAPVFDNVKKHEFVIRNAIVGLMEQTTAVDVYKPNFRKDLALKIRVVMNEILMKYEDFGGIEDVFFTSFVYQ